MKREILFAVALAVTFSAPVQAAKKKPKAPQSVAGVFDYYLLTLSSAPQFCNSHPNDQSAECKPHPEGFVLHGLWPQYAKGGWPQNCKFDAQRQPVPQLDSDGEAVGATAFPTTDLMNHEWAKHGTCSGMNSSAYFHAADDAHKAVKLPSLLQAGSNNRSVATSNLTQAILDANPTITRDSLRLMCVKGELSEVRVCLDKSLQPAACGKGVTNACGQTVKLLNVQ